MPIYFTGQTGPSLPLNSLQFNNAGAFAGDANLAWVPATGLTVSGGKYVKTLGSANALEIAGSSTSNPVTLTATGTDATVNVQLLAKGPYKPGLIVGRVPNIAFAEFLGGPGGKGFGGVIVTGDDADAASSFGAIAAGGARPALITLGGSNGTVETPTALPADVSIGGFDFYGFGTTAWQYAFSIYARTIAAFTDTAATNTTRLDFYSGDGTGVETFTVFGPGGLQLREVAAPSVSAAGTAKWYPDSTSHTLKLSLNTGAYLDVPTIAAGGLTASRPVFTDASKNLISAQGASVADATDAGSAITQLNLLISRLEGLNILATV